MNYVQVQFQRDHSLNFEGKLYTYRNRCDLVKGDYAVVDVAGAKKVVLVANVVEAPPPTCTVPEEGLKWILGAVYLDPHLDKVRRAKERLAELRALAIERMRQRQYTDFLSPSEAKEFNGLVSLASE